MGARYFEKHITLNKKSKGPDHFYAYNPKEFKRYVRNIHKAYNLWDPRLRKFIQM